MTKSFGVPRGIKLRNDDDAPSPAVFDHILKLFLGVILAVPATKCFLGLKLWVDLAFQTPSEVVCEVPVENV